MADNFDYNEDTTTGHYDTHVMGMIACQTACRTDQGATTVKRKLTSAAEIVKAGDFGQLIKPYQPNARGKIADVTFMQMKPVKVQTMLYELVDMLWLFSSLIHQSQPNWQGFMAKIVKGVWDCTVIMFHPMIPLNPSSDEAVYSTMVFVLHQAGKLNMCCAVLTLDQPLYLRAYRIKEESRHEFQNLTFAAWWFPSVDVIPGSRKWT